MRVTSDEIFSVEPLQINCYVVKRDGRVVDFDYHRIVNAIAKAGTATREFGRDTACYLASLVVKHLLIGLDGKDRVHVEEIQDIVERVLMESPYKRTAKAYILYRDQLSLIHI